MKTKKEIVTMLLAAALMTSSLTACTNVEAAGNNIDDAIVENMELENTLFLYSDTNNNLTNNCEQTMRVVLNNILQQEYTWLEFQALYPEYEITAQSPISMNIIIPEFDNVVFVFGGSLDDNISKYTMISVNASSTILLPEHFDKTFDVIIEEEGEKANYLLTDTIAQHLYKYEEIYIYRDDFYYYIRGWRHGEKLSSEHIAILRYNESHTRPY